MGVRHGYGKVAGADALVFAYDTGDTKNSYKGEPTVNEVYTHYDVTFETLADGNTAGFANQLGTGNYLGVDSTRGYKSTKSLRVNRGTGGSGRVYRTLGLTAGDNMTVTAWVYSDVAGPYIHLEYFGGDYSWYVPYTKNSHQGTGWEKLYATANSSATSNTTLYYFFYPNAENTDTYWDSVQVEKKTHATPFVNGSRSATQGLLDLTSTQGVDLAGASFDSNAQVDFDGTSDVIYSPELPVLDSFSLEVVIKPDSISGWILYRNSSMDYAGNADNFTFGFASGNRLYGQVEYSPSGADVYVYGTSSIPTGQYTHGLYTYDNTSKTLRMYVNGVLEGTTVHTGDNYPYRSTKKISIGADGGSNHGGVPGNKAFYNGQIPVVKVYNRALTASEVKNNYNNYKGRFNI